jgi:hypothetical protein
MTRSILTSALFLLLALGTQARAGFVIIISDATIAQGGTGSVDVYISSDNPSGDSLSSLSFQFQISPNGPGTLQFVSSQSDSQLSAANYVFANNSADLLGMPPTSVGNVTSQGNLYTGGDSPNDFVDAIVTTPTLLATLDVSAAAVTPSPGQDTHFTISLLNNIFTSFQTFDQNNDPISMSFSATPGTVTVTPRVSTVVPEPGPIVLLISGGSFSLVLARRAYRRRR